jgi:protein TonB
MTRSGFLSLSLLLHALVLGSLALAPGVPLTLAVPELAVSIPAPAAAQPGSRQRTVEPVPAPRQDTAAAEPAPATRASKVAGDTDSDAASRQQLRDNHLMAMLRNELAEHFVYPMLARRRGWEGEVHVAALLAADGSIHDLRLLGSSGYAVLDRDALATLARIGTLPRARHWLAGREFSFELPVLYRLTRG